jgi:exonuclease SbcD
MRIVHIADVHLDRPFVGLSLHAAKQRRADVIDALRRCLRLATDREADAVTIGGDLWEDENVTPDTRASVAHELGKLERPVVIVCGNHDPYLRGGVYQRTAWPDNIRIIETPAGVEVELASEVMLWAASWTERSLTSEFLRQAATRSDTHTRIALFHGTAQDERFPYAPSHCPFRSGDIRDSGFELALVGHIHAASDIDRVVYPGSPEPLDHTETGRHCCAVIDVGAGRVDVDLVDVNQRRCIHRSVDCTDAASSAEVETRAREAAGPSDVDTVLTLELTGETAPDCTIDDGLLRARLEQDFAGVALLDSTEPHVDYELMRGRPSADGLFVAEMKRRLDAAVDERERRVLDLALRAGVRAMSGQKDVLRVG